jgi:hypothetical protein
MKEKIKLEKLINDILEEMIETMGDGGMDTSFIGWRYEEAKIKATEKILKLLKNNQL